MAFWLIWFINQRALSVMRRRHWGHRLCTPTSPSHRFEHRNFIFGTDMCNYVHNMHIKYLMILTSGF